MSFRIFIKNASIVNEGSVRTGHVVVGHVATLGDLAKLRGLVGTHNAQLVCAAPRGEKSERVQERES